jgi:4-amino-4-deoxy-L-arabinose transferase-like glycosyltransferase
LESTPPIRSRAAEEGSFEIPLWGVPLVLVILWVCLFSGLGAIGLVGPDEPRYAAIARAMAETHDWITPRLWGTPWFEKPVLYYWTAGLAMRLFGVSEFAARLPSALAGLLAVAAAAWAALRSYGLGAAWYTLLMLPTSVAMIGFSRAAGPDMLFAGLLTAAMAVAAEMLQRDKPGPILQIAFGFFLGAAVLAKGPAAVILAGGATLAWAALSRQWTAPFRFLHPVVIGAFCVTALPWYVLCALRNPDFLHVFIWQHNFERYTTPIFEHRQPFWYYGYILLLAVLPWIIAFLAALLVAIVRLKNKAAIESNETFFASWALFPVLFFSISQSKLPGYILPAIPPLFILLGRWVSESVAKKAKGGVLAFALTGIALIVLAVALGIIRFGGPYEIRIARYTLAVITFVVGGSIVVLALRKQTMAACWLMALMVFSTVEIANQLVLPQLDSVISCRQLAKKLLQDGVREEDLAVYGIPRTLQYGLDYYMNRELPRWAASADEPKWVLVGLPLGRRIANEYEIVDDNPLDRYIPTFSLYRKR